jgi:hypothetical protein
MRTLIVSGFYFSRILKRDRGTQRHLMPTPLVNARTNRKPKRKMLINARAMARTFNKISVPPERGRFAQPLLPARPYYPSTSPV